MLGILGVVNEEFFAGGQFLHVGGGGGQFFGQNCFSYFLMIWTNLKDFLGFNHFWRGRPFLHGGGCKFFGQFFFYFLMVWTNLKEFWVSSIFGWVDHFYMGMGVNFWSKNVFLTFWWFKQIWRNFWVSTILL